MMLKKMLSLFRRPVPEKTVVNTVPVRCYQPDLPFDQDFISYRMRDRQKFRRTADEQFCTYGGR